MARYQWEVLIWTFVYLGLKNLLWDFQSLAVFYWVKPFFSQILFEFLKKNVLIKFFNEKLLFGSKTVPFFGKRIPKIRKKI
jgi:hypothetical protein